MSISGNDSPFGRLDLTPQGGAEPEQPETPLAEVVAAGDAAQAARLQDEAAHLAAEEPEKTRADIRIAVETEWDYCGLEPCDASAELATDILAEFQADEQAYDPTYVLGDTETARDIAEIVALRIQFREQHGEREEERTEAEETETDETLADEDTAQGAETTAEDREATAETYQEAVDELAGMSTAEKMQALVADNRVPETYKEQLRAFNQIIAVADRVPADAAIVRQHINQIDLSQGVPSPASFARAFIFDSPNRATGVSAATQEAIASELGISLHGVEPPRNASDLQTTLREGRGVERETEIRRVERPEGSGNWVEEEVVVSERVLPFTESEPVIISLNPRVEAFPIAEGSQTHEVKAYVAAGEPTRLHVDIPESWALPTADINHFVVASQTQALLANRGYAGAFNELLGAGDSTTGLSTSAVRPTFGQSDPSRVMTQTLAGSDFVADGRFLDQAVLNNMEGNLRSMAPFGDFGAFNRMDPAQATALMRGLLGNGQSNVVSNLNRLRDVISTGGVDALSYQATYDAMYPEDAAAGYPRLRGIIGDDGMDELGLSKPE